MKLSHLIFILSAFLFFNCQKQYAQNIQTVTAEIFEKKISSTKKPQVIDVRTPNEYNKGHLIQATNINWLDSQFDIEARKLDKSKPVFVYCQSGGRSAKASSKLKELGFTTIYELDGGFMKWNAQGNKSSKN
jgi:rhodanese-related sulfurtransferase